MNQHKHKKKFIYNCEWVVINCVAVDVYLSYEYIQISCSNTINYTNLLLVRNYFDCNLHKPYI